MYQMRYCCVVTLAATMLAGCTSTRPRYQQPAGDPSSLATLKMSQRHLGIFAIDGADALSVSQYVFSGQGFPESYYVTPGKHTVLAIDGGRENSMTLWILAEPGKEYLLRMESGDHRYRMWFEDASNGRVVGGLVGSDDEPKEPVKK